MADNEEKIPYKLTFGGGVQPSDAAWANVARIPTEDYDREFNEGITPEELKSTPYVDVQHSALHESMSKLIVSVNQDKLITFNRLIQAEMHGLERMGYSDDQIEHMINIFSIGILLGIKSVEMTQRYAEQGIHEIESNPES